MQQRVCLMIGPLLLPLGLLCELLAHIVIVITTLCLLCIHPLWRPFHKLQSVTLYSVAAWFGWCNHSLTAALSAVALFTVLKQLRAAAGRQFISLLLSFA